MTVKLAIVGTRVLACPGDRITTEKMIAYEIDTVSPDIIISGGAPGVDSIAEAVARELGYSEEDDTLVIHRPTTKRWSGPGGFQERNTLIAVDCTHLLRLACHQADTFGSGWTAAHAAGLGKPVNDWTVCDDEEYGDD